MIARHVHKNSRDLERTTAKLSSGKRINQAADDAARLAISTNLNAMTRGKSMAMRNSNDAISMIQVAEGSLSEVSSQLTRMKELALQSASSGVSSVERDMIQNEAQSMIRQIDSVAGVASIFGKQMINGGNKKLDFQIDAVSGSNSRISLDLSELNMTSQGLGVGSGSINLDTQYGAQSSIEKLTNAFDKLNSVGTKLGSMQNRLQASIHNLGNGIENFKAANSTIMDTDYALETANNVKENMRQSATTSVASQINFDLDQAVRLVG
jgi:flagellin